MLVGILPVFVMDQKGARWELTVRQIYHSSWIKQPKCSSVAMWVVHKIYAASKYHLQAREFVVDTPMNFLLIPTESVTMGILISVSLPQHVLPFLFEVIPLEIYSKNGIHHVPSWIHSSWNWTPHEHRRPRESEFELLFLGWKPYQSYPRLRNDLGFVESFLFLFELISNNTQSQGHCQ